MGNLIFPRGLSEKNLGEILELEKECCKYENLNMKLNLDMLNTRSVNENNDLLYYADDRLIGFLGLYAFGPQPEKIEITGMVHPDYRRKGVFKELFLAAQRECCARGAKQILIITERFSDAGTCFAKSTGAQYSFSEYRMKFTETVVPSFPSLGVTVRKAESKDNPELRHLDALCFGVVDDDEHADNADNEDNSTYIAELNGKFIGKIRYTMDGNDGYIFGFVIKPEYRGQGYGRSLLSAMLTKLVSEQIKVILLEVETKNDNALGLYKSCGFKELTIYDYYDIILKEPCLEPKG